MGTYASNSITITIPRDEVANITAQFRADAAGILDEQWDANTPEENLVGIIVENFGSEDYPEPQIVGDRISIIADTYGKVGIDLETLLNVLAVHGAEGIVEQQVGDEHWLYEIGGGEFHEHRGVITYPTYKGFDE